MVYVILAAAAIIIYLVFDNRRLSVSRYSLKSEHLPNAFDAFRIVQLSDVHGARFGKNNRRLLSKVAAQNPDIIVITGDIIDVRNPSEERAKSLVTSLVKIAPVYFVSGNHEARYNNYESLENMLMECGVTVLENRTAYIVKNDEKILICGIKDPRFTTDYDFENSRRVICEELEMLDGGARDFRILLSHRPEQFSAYCEEGIDLVFAGHAHGGQFRLPLLGGLYVPLEGFFPKYDAGHFQSGKTHMLVSRGIGKSIVPVRIGNPPDIVVAELTKPQL